MLLSRALLKVEDFRLQQPPYLQYLFVTCRFVMGQLISYINIYMIYKSFSLQFVSVPESRLWRRNMTFLDREMKEHGRKLRRSTKILKHTENLFRKSLQLKGVSKGIQIIVQRKAFYRQRIPEPNCARKRTVDTDILVTSMNGDGKIMKSIRITSRVPSRM